MGKDARDPTSTFMSAKIAEEEAKAKAKAEASIRHVPPKPRDANGRLLPGHGALNPGGRPRGIERRMRELVESQLEKWDGRTLDGWEAMTMMMYKVAMGKPPPGELTPITMKDRMAAVQFLFDRVHGKAKIQIESDTTVHTGNLANLNVDDLDPAELDALEAHVELVAARASGKATATVIDVSPADVLEDHEE